MKVAVCLYGQPRNYILGNKNIKRWMKYNQNISFDFFIHCWISEKKMECSPWSNTDKNLLKIKDKEKLSNDIKQMYEPKNYCFENTIDDFKNFNIENSLIFNQTNETKKKNINNVLSQIYSRNKVRDLLLEYIKENNVEYDFIVICRIDLKNYSNIRLKDMKKKQMKFQNLIWRNCYFVIIYFILTLMKLFIQIK